MLLHVKINYLIEGQLQQSQCTVHPVPHSFSPNLYIPIPFILHTLYTIHSPRTCTSLYRLFCTPCTAFILPEPVQCTSLYRLYCTPWTPFILPEPVHPYTVYFAHHVQHSFSSNLYITIPFILYTLYSIHSLRTCTSLYRLFCTLCTAFILPEPVKPRFGQYFHTRSANKETHCPFAGNRINRRKEENSPFAGSE